MNEGMWPGVVEVTPDDDYGARGNDDMFDVYDEFDAKPKKNANKKKTPVEIKYEGYSLEKAQPHPGERSSWARVGQRSLLYDEKTLIDIAKRHRKSMPSKSTVIDDFQKLFTSNQQGVINRLLDDRRRKEKTKNADWILYDVQRIGNRTWRSVDVRSLQVILKRVDKTIPLKNGEYVKQSVKNQFQDFEIIDLAEPTTTIKQKKDKKVKKSRSLDDMFDSIEGGGDPLGLGMGMGAVPPPPRNHGRNNNNHNNQMPRNDHMQFEQMPGMPPPPPPHQPNGILGGFNFDQPGPGQFQQPQYPQPQYPQPQQFHQQQPTSARQSLTNVQHPFQPHPEVASMAQFDPLPPINHDPQWPHPHQHEMEQNRTRSHSRPRRPSARRPSISIDTGDVRRLENKIEDLTAQISNLRTGSESSDNGDDSLFSYASDDRSWTPPSSPHSYFSDNKARGSLERRRSSTTRDPRYLPSSRSHRYRDVEIQPAYSHRKDRREYQTEYRRNSRPALLHSQTYDDYPTGTAAEPRYLPAAPQPPRPVRRLTEYGNDRYENRGYDDRRQNDLRYGDSRDSPDSRRFADRYDDGRRGSLFDRRSSYAGGGRQYYD